MTETGNTFDHPTLQFVPPIPIELGPGAIFYTPLLSITLDKTALILGMVIQGIEF